MTEDFIIPLNGLPSGKSNYSRKVGKEFFVGFENSDVLDADLAVESCIEKSGNYIGVDVMIEGSVTVPCDRCLEDLIIPVDKTVLLSVKFGEEPSDADPDLQEGEREIVYLPDVSADLDLSQVVYDYACLEIPMQRVHEDGGCNPETLKYLDKESEPSPSEEVQDSPFAALKGLFNN